jgi:hypothetical protein
MSLNPPNNPINNLSNQTPNYCISKEDDPEFLKRKMFLQALQTALILVGAFIFYDITKIFQKPLLHLVQQNMYWYHMIRTITHVLFIFLLDISLRYIFAFLFNIPI